MKGSISYNSFVLNNRDSISGVKISSSNLFSKGSGILTALSSENIGWKIERIFFITSELPEERGDHAHKTCKQVFVCVSGEVKIVCNDGNSEKEFQLSGLGNNLYVPPGIWVSIKMGSKTSIAVITDQTYDESDYIRNWGDFMIYTGNT